MKVFVDAFRSVMLPCTQTGVFQFLDGLSGNTLMVDIVANVSKENSVFLVSVIKTIMYYSRLHKILVGDGSEVRRLFGPGSEVCLTVNLGGFKYCIGPAR